MISLTIDIKSSLHEAFDMKMGKGGRMPPGMGKVIKAAMQQTLLFWHREFIKGHFERKAYVLYGADYPEPKKSPRKPFVKTGALRGRMISRKGIQHTRGTSNRMALHLPIGRPRQSGQERINVDFYAKREAKNLSRNPGMSRAEANRKAYQVGYGKKNVDIFQRGITATTTRQEERMADFMGEYIAKELGKPRPLRRIAIIRR